MKRVMLKVAYDGTDYCGWQRQNNGITVQQVLEEELSRMLGEEIQVLGCSRTDSGVHSLGNLCVFDTDARIPADKISYALNQRLPEDISVMRSQEVPPNFHPRKWDSVKTYEYTIYNGRMRNPIYRKYSLFHYGKLDVLAMQAAAGYVVGEHDFASFCSAGSTADTTWRTVYSCTVTQEGDLIRIRITGSGFLYNMVRIIAGTLMKIGSGQWKPDKMRKIIAARDRQAAGPTAPPEGLCLMEIELLDPPFDVEEEPL